MTSEFPWQVPVIQNSVSISWHHNIRHIRKNGKPLTIIMNLSDGLIRNSLQITNLRELNRYHKTCREIIKKGRREKNTGKLPNNDNDLDPTSTASDYISYIGAVFSTRMWPPSARKCGQSLYHRISMKWITLINHTQQAIVGMSTRFDFIFKIIFCTHFPADNCL